jgi:hypothetical protein
MRNTIVVKNLDLVKALVVSCVKGPNGLAANCGY